MKHIDPSWMAFLVMTFAVVGLTGLFATFAAPLALERALARDRAFDEALLAATPQALAALADRLGDSAEALKGPSDQLPARIAAARAAAHTKFEAEAADTALKLRWLIVVATIMSSVFGIVILGAAARPGNSQPNG